MLVNKQQAPSESKAMEKKKKKRQGKTTTHSRPHTGALYLGGKLAYPA